MTNGQLCHGANSAWEHPTRLDRILGGEVEELVLRFAGGGTRSRGALVLVELDGARLIKRGEEAGCNGEGEGRCGERQSDEPLELSTRELRFVFHDE